MLVLINQYNVVRITVENNKLYLRHICHISFSVSFISWMILFFLFSILGFVLKVNYKAALL